MAEDKRVELLQELIRVLQEDRVYPASVWRPTAKLNEFTSAFMGRYSVLIGKDSSGSCYFRMEDIRDGRELLSFRATPPSGAAEQASSETDRRATQLVGELYAVVRDKARQVDRTIDEILQQLKHT